MTTKNIKIKSLVILLIFLMFFVQITSAQKSTISEKNMTVQEEAELCLKESEKTLVELQQNNYSIQRINDSLKEAKVFYEDHKFLKEKSGRYDFSLIIPYCDEIKHAKVKAYESSDQLNALIKFYQEFLTEKVNTSTADKIIDEIKTAMNDEKYERVESLVDEAYKEIVNIKSSQTAINLFYESTSRNLKKFIIKNWIYLVSTVFVMILLFIIYKKTISRMIINNKIKKLELRKEIIKKLIMKTQKDYFEGGKFSENVYRIKTKKLSELVRDIDRQIPLLKEDLVKVEKNKGKTLEKDRELDLIAEEKIKKRARSNKKK